MYTVASVTNNKHRIVIFLALNILVHVSGKLSMHPSHCSLRHLSIPCCTSVCDVWILYQAPKSIQNFKAFVAPKNIFQGKIYFIVKMKDHVNGKLI